MKQTPSPDPRHEAVRSFLRVAGPAVVLVALIFSIVGVVSFFSSFGSFEPPRYFWCLFVGMPLLVLGAALSQYGYMGAMAGYMSKELTPAGRDTFNNMAAGIQPGLRDVGESIAQGVRAGMAPPARQVYCPKCGAANDTDAKFCKNCGAALQTSGT